MMKTHAFTGLTELAEVESTVVPYQNGWHAAASEALETPAVKVHQNSIRAPANCTATNATAESGGGPGEVFFAERDLQNAFGRQDVDRESAFPQGDADQQFAAVAKIEEFAREAEIEDFVVRSGHGCFKMQQAQAALFEDRAGRQAPVF